MTTIPTPADWPAEARLPTHPDANPEDNDTLQHIDALLADPDPRYDPVHPNYDPALVAAIHDPDDDFAGTTPTDTTEDTT